MEIIIRRRDVYVCALLLLAFGSWVAYAAYDTHAMRLRLEDLARVHIEDYFERGEKKLDKSDFDYLAIIDCGKAYNLFGRPYGVVHTYFKLKGDEKFATFEGIEYFYEWNNGAWLLTDSAGCGAVQHHIRAFDEFVAKNVDVPDKVFHRALGIDFLGDHDHAHDHDHRDNHDHDHAHTLKRTNPGSLVIIDGQALHPKYDREEIEQAKNAALKETNSSTSINEESAIREATLPEQIADGANGGTES